MQIKFNHIKNNLSKIALLLIAVITIVFTYNNRVVENKWERAIDSDGRGYYAYLPAVFIYQDWDWGFVFENEKKLYPNTPYVAGDYLNTVDNDLVNRYFSGTALLMLPFFLLAMGFSYLLGFPIDGYSMPFFIAIIFASLFYFLAGLYFIRKTLLKYNFSELTIAVVLISFGLGTNLFHYATIETSMSHVYSFFLISLFIYYAKSLSENYTFKRIIKLGLVVSLIFLVRPTNVLVVLFLPFFFSDGKSLIAFLKKYVTDYKALFITILIFILIVSIQPIFYYLQVGKPWVYAYYDAKLILSEPHLIKVLFSYRKGLFVYTPITFIAILGLIFLIKKNKFQTITWLLAFMVFTYILSSWSWWWYGGSFGMRPFIELFPLFTILLAILVQAFKKIYFKGIIILLLLLLCRVNFIQAYQYRTFILHWNLMNKESYWKVFLKTDLKYSGVLWTETDYNKPFNGKLILNSENDFEEPMENWHSNENTINFNKAKSGNRITSVSENGIYGETFSTPLHWEESKKESIVIKITSDLFAITDSSEAKLVVALQDSTKENTKHWSAKPNLSVFDKSIINQWYKHYYTVKIDSCEKGDILSIYFLNTGKSPFYIDNMKIEAYKISNDE
ncbi:MAG: hypothetical protein K0B10_13855 [Vicingaceae bacterium]|nr:hypothetical protein [Vicingaceae bacterium]